MMLKKTLILLFCILPILSGCSNDSTQTHEPAKSIDLNTLTFTHSMKGWELYSWKNGDDWNYSILIGTDRLKSYDEVKTNEIIVTGEDTLKMVLDKFPEGEIITWIGQGWLKRCWGNNYYDLSLPPEEIIDEIKQFCSQINLVLQIMY